MTTAVQSFTRTSVARVLTDHPAQYGRQLASHMGRKITTTWDEESATGSLSFDRDGAVTGVVDLACEEGVLVMTLRTTTERLEYLEQVAGNHLARFGHKDRLAIAWTRDDGAGTAQGPLTEEDVERMRAERRARLDAAERG